MIKNHRHLCLYSLDLCVSEINTLSVELCMQFGIQTRTFQDLTAVADFVRNNNVPLLFVALLLLHFLSMVIDR